MSDNINTENLYPVQQRESNDAEVEGPSERLTALAQTVSVVKDTFIEDINQKDRIIELAVSKIEQELNAM